MPSPCVSLFAPADELDFVDPDGRHFRHKGRDAEGEYVYNDSDLDEAGAPRKHRSFSRSSGAGGGGGGGGGGAWGSSRMGTVRSPDHSPTRHRVKPLSPREADFESTASSCHWCRHPQPLRVCLRCSLCRDVLFCMRCYGARMCRPSARDAEVADALARRASWICPPCRGYCNCSGQGPKAHLFKLTGNRASGQMNSFCKSLDLTVNEILEQTEFSPLSVAYTLKKIKWPGRAKGRHPWPTAEQRVTTAALPSSRSPPRAGPTSVPEGGEGDPAPPQSRPPFD